jgi:hypothetical protein
MDEDVAGVVLLLKSFTFIIITGLFERGYSGTKLNETKCFGELTTIHNSRGETETQLN